MVCIDSHMLRENDADDGGDSRLNKSMCLSVNRSFISFTTCHAAAARLNIGLVNRASLKSPPNVRRRAKS